MYLTKHFSRFIFAYNIKKKIIFILSAYQKHVKKPTDCDDMVLDIVLPHILARKKTLHTHFLPPQYTKAYCTKHNTHGTELYSPIFYIIHTLQTDDAFILTRAYSILYDIVPSILHNNVCFMKRIHIINMFVTLLFFFVFSLFFSMSIHD